MSNLAYAPSPRRAPREVPQRRVEIVSTRAQRRARPRPLYAIVAVGGILALFLAQLLMSIVVSDGAYQISSLQAEQSTLTRQQQSLGEQVDTLASTQNLAVKAQALGMVQSTALPAFLDVATGRITGTSHSAKGGSTTSNAVNLVPNSLLPDATPTGGVATTTTPNVVDPNDTSTDATGTTSDTGTSTISTTGVGTTTGAPATTTSTPPVASQSGLPIPVTR